MRIISGKYKGRKVEGYNIEGTRPTMDRVKESVIAMIQNKIDDSVCLDLFTGSGSIGFELLSNGAKKCYLVDNNNIVIKTLKKNIINLKVDSDYELVQNDFRKALEDFNRRNIKFDIVYLDPPYKNNFIMPSIDLLVSLDLLNDDAVVICEFESEKIDTDKLKLIKEKRYGSKYVNIYKKLS